MLGIWDFVYPEVRYAVSFETSIRLCRLAQGHVPEDHNVDVYLFWCAWDWLLNLYLSSETSETDLYLTASPLQTGLIHCPETSVANYKSLSIRLCRLAQGHVPVDHNVDLYLFWCAWDWLLNLYLSSETSETDLYLTASPLQSGLIHCPETSVANYKSLPRIDPEKGMSKLWLLDKIQVVWKRWTFWFVCGGCLAGISVRYRL